MRSGFTWLTALAAAAIAFGACGGEPTKVTTFRVGADGKPDMSTAREEVVLDRSALNSVGWGYSWDCRNDSSLFVGELKAYFYSGIPHDGSFCRGWGLGGSNGMALSMPEWTWPGSTWAMDSSDGFTNPASYETVAPTAAGTHHARWCWYRNAQFGNFSPSGGDFGAFPHGGECHDGMLPGGYHWANLQTNPNNGGTGRSFDYSRWCGPGNTPC